MLKMKYLKSTFLHKI